MRGKILCTLTGVVLGALGIMLLRPAGGVRPPAPERVTEAELALDRPLGEVDFENTPLEQAVATLERASGAPIVVDWEDLEPKGLKRSQPVTLRARGIRLDEALDRVLQPLNAFPDGPITYSAETGKVVIGTAERVASNLIVRMYDVCDLLGPEAPPNPPTTLPASAAGNACWFGKGPPPMTSTVITPTDYERRLSGLRSVLQDTVDPESWQRAAANGTGTAASISGFGGRLVVTQTWPAHRQVRAALRMLRNVAAPDFPAAASPTKLWRSEVNRWASVDTAPAEAGLLRIIPELRFHQASFDRAVSVLSQHAGVPIHIRRDLLRKFWGTDVPVELWLKDVPVYKALEFLLLTQSTGYTAGEGPAYGVDGGTIVISTQDDAAKLLITRAYNLRQWLWRDLFTDGPASTHETAQGNATRLITEEIAPPSWRDNGGFGSLVFFDDIMVVRQTWPNHEKLRRLMLDLQGAVASPSTQPVSVHEQ